MPMFDEIKLGVNALAFIFRRLFSSEKKPRDLNQTINQQPKPFFERFGREFEGTTFDAFGRLRPKWRCLADKSNLAKGVSLLYFP